MSLLVSIIIPAFNRAHLIENTLNSIIKQSYTNWECIIVDDGSIDVTEKLIQSYLNNDKRFQFHKRPNHMPKGANACRNYGFTLSKGKFINWFDSDDIMSTNKLELQVKALQTKNDAPFCVCQSYWFDSDSNISLGLRSKTITSSNRFEDYCLFRVFWLTSVPLWRREFIDLHSLNFDETLQQSQEYDFHIKALAISDDYITIDEPLVTIIKHDGAISHNIYLSDEKLFSNLKVKKRLLENYSYKLSSIGKLKIHEMITVNFKELLLLKNFTMAKVYSKTLIHTLKYIDVSWITKFNFSMRLILILQSYCIFGRGYRFIKPLK